MQAIFFYTSENLQIIARAQAPACSTRQLEKKIACAQIGKIEQDLFCTETKTYNPKAWLCW